MRFVSVLFIMVVALPVFSKDLGVFRSNEAYSDSRVHVSGSTLLINTKSTSWQFEKNDLNSNIFIESHGHGSSITLLNEESLIWSIGNGVQVNYFRVKSCD